MSAGTAGGLGFNRPNIHQKMTARNATLSGTPNFPPGPRQQPSQTAGMLKSLSTVESGDLLQRDVSSLSKAVTEERGHVRKQISDLSDRASALHNEMQVVYARATEALYGIETHGADFDSATEVAGKGEQVALLYPMHERAMEGGCKTYMMRLKRAHPVTGQLSMHWVRVCDMDGAGKVTKRRIGKFSVIPF